jgi:hypothetical protein
MEIKMNDRKNQTPTNNQINLQADTLTDLPVADDQAEETKGGTVSGKERWIEVQGWDWEIDA